MPAVHPYGHRDIEGIHAYFRQNTTDEKVLREVVDRRGYRRVGINFDVEPGEYWLDLGANIGAFAIYCRLRNATVKCYEPDSDCYKILLKNANGAACVNAAVTSSTEEHIQFWRSANQQNHYRGSILRQGGMRSHVPVNNVWAGALTEVYDGVKMDIEGSEFGIIDAGLIPKCNKLCMEYHTSRDPSMENLAKRLGLLKELFYNVSYPPEYDRRIAQGGPSKTYFDRFVFCWGRK